MEGSKIGQQKKQNTPEIEKRDKRKREMTCQLNTNRRDGYERKKKNTHNKRVSQAVITIIVKRNVTKHSYYTR
ncbi:uncharacterized protein VTP21DRAFT_11404 [Calcarisporiella thermophila]|uniref:uncharacterized protein n=1 Tax=Calcarisporiella thermophila TaxID=911321 RepID=UPI0037447585